MISHIERAIIPNLKCFRGLDLITIILTMWNMFALFHRGESWESMWFTDTFLVESNIIVVRDQHILLRLDLDISFLAMLTVSSTDSVQSVSVDSKSISKVSSRCLGRACFSCLTAMWSLFASHTWQLHLTNAKPRFPLCLVSDWAHFLQLTLWFVGFNY